MAAGCRRDRQPARRRHGQVAGHRIFATGHRRGGADARRCGRDQGREGRGAVPRHPRPAHLRGRERGAAADHRPRFTEGGKHMKILQPPGWPRPKGYSNGISAKGRMIFTGGIVGWDEHESFPEYRLHEQFARALRNTLTILAEDGAGPEHVVRMTCYIIDRDEYLSQRDEIGAAWREIMGRSYPAMALVEVQRLVESAALIEIETTAVVPE